jgi:hypothetical protein
MTKISWLNAELNRWRLKPRLPRPQGHDHTFRRNELLIHVLLWRCDSATTLARGSPLGSCRRVVDPKMSVRGLFPQIMSASQPCLD